MTYNNEGKLTVLSHILRELHKVSFILVNFSHTQVLYRTRTKNASLYHTTRLP
jgi:hypothetical protein